MPIVLAKGEAIAKLKAGTVEHNTFEIFALPTELSHKQPIAISALSHKAYATMVMRKPINKANPIAVAIGTKSIAI